MGELLLILCIMMVFVSVIGFLFLQWKISSSSKGKKGLKTIGNFFAIMIVPAIFIFLTIPILIHFNIGDVNENGGAVGWLYIIYLWSLPVVAGIKALLLVIIHFIAKFVKKKKMQGER